MRAVNLIPLDQRRNTSVAGRSGGAAYVVLAVLVLLVAGVSAYTIAGRQVDDKRSELASIRVQADELEADAQRYAAYTKFADLRKQRTETVAALAQSRFDWARGLRELARTVPAGLKLSSLSASVSGAGAGTSGTSPTASGGSPSMDLSGCVPGGQDGSAALISSLRRMEGVQRVSLASSEKADGASGGGTAGSSSGGGDCGRGAARFSLTVAFSPPAPAAPSAGTTQTTSTGVTP